MFGKFLLFLCSEVNIIWPARKLQRHGKLFSCILFSFYSRTTSTSAATTPVHCLQCLHSRIVFIHLLIQFCSCNKSLKKSATEQSNMMHYLLILSEDEKLSISLKDFSAFKTRSLILAQMPNCCLMWIHTRTLVIFPGKRKEKLSVFNWKRQYTGKSRYIHTCDY